MLVKSDLYFRTECYGVSDIRSRYSGSIDLYDKKGIINDDVCDAILEASHKDASVIIPEHVESRYSGAPSRPYFWNRSEIRKIDGQKVPMDTALRFMKFGPQIDLTLKSTTLRDIKDYNLTPRNAFRELDVEKKREALKKGSYRGIGWWDPKRKKHKLLPFEVPVEGEAFNERFSDEMIFEKLRSDAMVKVPSISRYMKKDYVVIMRVLPVTDGKYIHEWLMTDVFDGCEGRFYNESGGKKFDGAGFVDLYKYASPEDVYCRHCWGALLAAEEKSHRDADVPPFRLSYPRVTEDLRDAWKTLNMKTIVKSPGGRERRPQKTEARIQLGRIIGFLGANGSFDLTE
ncbi:MAG: hypothetical protein JW789_05230 [Candidatus Aenigmarchaeota archaeon]|nr:hypothetical protein [Candidatus Aenigmarchaeota archaeon]